MKDEGVSSVVSAVLVFSLFSTAFLMWTITQLPNWVEEREDNHASLMRETLGGLQATLEEMAGTGNAGPATRSISLGPAPVPVLQRTPTSGTLSIEDGLALTGTFGNGALHVLGTSPAGTPDASLATASNDVANLEFLFLQFTSNSVASGEMAQVIMTASDGSDTVTARIVQTDLNLGTYQRTTCDSMELHVQVTNILGVTTTQVIQCRLGFDASLRLNLLDDDIGLQAALGDLEPGFDLTWGSSASGGGTAGGSSYGAVWRDSSGLTRVSGTGIASAYSLDEETKALVMDTRAQQLDAQDIAWEAGALAVSQATGMALPIVPSMELSVDGTLGSLRWTIVLLSGTETTITGDQATVSMRMTGATDVVLGADTADFTLNGTRAAAWRGHMQDLVDIDGIPDVTVGGTGEIATLTLGDSTVTSWTVHLRIIEASISLR